MLQYDEQIGQIIKIKVRINCPLIIGSYDINNIMPKSQNKVEVISFESEQEKKNKAEDNDISSQMISEYNNFFHSAGTITLEEILSRLNDNNSKFQTEPEFMSDIYIKAQKIDCQSSIIKLHYGYLSLIVDVTSLNTTFDFSQEEVAGKGQFGMVYKSEFQGKLIAIKAIPFRKPYHKTFIQATKKIFAQYFLALLASELQVGPKIIKAFTYDIVFLRQCALIAMEYCHLFESALFDKQRNKKEEEALHELKKSLYCLHSLHIIHHDIKPNNICWSPSFNKYVFIDFGLSVIVRQKKGKKSRSMFCGSYSYCYAEMKKRYTLKSPGYVDLYYNDVYGLSTAIGQRVKIIPFIQPPQQVDSPDKKQEANSRKTLTILMQYFNILYKLYQNDHKGFISKSRETKYLHNSLCQLICSMLLRKQNNAQSYEQLKKLQKDLIEQMGKITTSSHTVDKLICNELQKAGDSIFISLDDLDFFKYIQIQTDDKNRVKKLFFFINPVHISEKTVEKEGSCNLLMINCYTMTKNIFKIISSRQNNRILLYQHQENLRYYQKLFRQSGLVDWFQHLANLYTVIQDYRSASRLKIYMLQICKRDYKHLLLAFKFYIQDFVQKKMKMSKPRQTYYKIIQQFVTPTNWNILSTSNIQKIKKITSYLHSNNNDNKQQKYQKLYRMFKQFNLQQQTTINKDYYNNGYKLILNEYMRILKKKKKVSVNNKQFLQHYYSVDLQLSSVISQVYFNRYILTQIYRFIMSRSCYQFFISDLPLQENQEMCQIFFVNYQGDFRDTMLEKALLNSQFDLPPGKILSFLQTQLKWCYKYKQQMRTFDFIYSKLQFIFNLLRKTEFQPLSQFYQLIQKAIQIVKFYRQKNIDLLSCQAERCAIDQIGELIINFRLFVPEEMQMQKLQQKQQRIINLMSVFENVIYHMKEIDQNRMCLLLAVFDFLKIFRQKQIVGKINITNKVMGLWKKIESKQENYHNFSILKEIIAIQNEKYYEPVKNYNFLIQMIEFDEYDDQEVETIILYDSIFPNIHEFCETTIPAFLAMILLNKFNIYYETGALESLVQNSKLSYLMTWMFINSAHCSLYKDPKKFTFFISLSLPNMSPHCRNLILPYYYKIVVKLLRNRKSRQMRSMRRQLKYLNNWNNTQKIMQRLGLDLTKKRQRGQSLYWFFEIKINAIKSNILMGFI